MKTTVSKACTRVLHPLTEVVTIWRTWQRRRRSRRGLTRRHWKPDENDNLDVIATTEQLSKTAFQSDVQVEPSEEVPDNSESITSADARKIECKFAARNVTELIVENGQQADKGRITRFKRCR